MTSSVQTAKEKTAARGPAQPRLTYCNLFFAFLTASFLGAVTETGFMLLVWHELQNRSGVVWGTFSLVWGGGAVLFALLLRAPARRGPAWVFLGGAALGSAFELLCSLFQERAFGMRFWDYSHLSLSLGGRVDPVFSLFWGLAAVAWMCLLWPALARFLEGVSPRLLRWSAGLLTVFMLCNVTLSAAALGRMDQRRQGEPPANGVEVFLDRRYPDRRLEERFPSMRYYGTGPAGNLPNS